MTTAVPDWYEEADAERAAYEGAIKRIRSDQSLSYQGRQRAIAKAFTTLRAKVTRLVTEADEAARAERRRVEQRLFGVPGNDPAKMLAERDAYGRAQATESPDQAKALFIQAEQTGDAALARAVLNVAVQRYRLHTGWQSIAREWAEAHPARVEDLDAYIRARTETRSLQARLLEEAHRQPMKPEELANLTDRDVEALADTT
jgi:hypothetical protein